MKLGILAVADSSSKRRNFLQTMSPPLGLLSLKAYLGKRLPDVDFHWSYDVDEIVRWKPDLIGLSSVTENFGCVSDLAAQLGGEAGVPVILGGVHISLLPGQLPETCALGVLGEGEETLTELLRLYAAAGSFPADKLTEIAGIVFRHPLHDLVQTTRREPVTPLDSIPFPRREKADLSDTVHVITSRGCPYQCVFCSSPTLWPTFRMFSADHVCAELCWIKERIDPPYVKFMDDLFIADTSRLERLAVLLKNEGIAFRQGFRAFARPNLLTDHLLSVLKDIGFVELALGLESGSPVILNRMGKKTTLEINQRALDACARHGIPVCGSFLIGVPGETVDDLEATLGFIRRNRRTFSEIEICPVVPFPGTPLWLDARKQGLVDEKMDWGLLRDHSDFVEFRTDEYLYLNPVMSRAAFDNYCHKFLQLYHEVSASRIRIVGEGAEERGL